MRWFGAHLTFKLFLSYLLVILVGIATLIAVADTVAPRFVDNHMARMLETMRGRSIPGPMTGMMGGAPPVGPLTSQQFETAFRDAMTEALLFSGGAAALVALLASIFVSRQIVRPLQRMVRATHRIASGHYAERVPIGSANRGDELGRLANSFNEMAGALEATERRRLDLVGDVAHELRTPIATLEGYLEGLLDGVVDPSERTWAKLHDEAGRLRRLVDDLQELSRAEARQLPLVVRPVPAAAIVQVAVDRLRGQFEDKGLELQSTTPPELPTVRADQDRAVQVLTNLLTNALRYTPAPGVVDVGAERSADVVTFRVVDSGIGFAPEHGPYLFERFYRVDKSRSRSLGGSGIGLTIARALVEAMGGRIWAESLGPGRGSTFAFTLPVAG